MRSTLAWALVFVAGLGILHAVSPGRPAVAVDDPGFQAFLRDFERGTPRPIEYVSTVVSGELAYTVGIERRAAPTSATAGAGPTRRVIDLFRKEGGHWTLLQRHADPLNDPAAPASEPRAVRSTSGS